MTSKLPESTRLTYARQLADEAKTLVPGMERLSAIAEELRADDLYRLLGFDTWERFCSDYLGVSKRTANRWIAGPKPKSITAGQGVAAGQNVPVVESDAIKSPAASTEAPAKPSAGMVKDTTVNASASSDVAPIPADPSSGGAEVQPMLSAAADLIERDGWCQGMPDGTGPVCAGVAIIKASRSSRLHSVAGGFLCREIGQPLITPWNDAPGRTMGQVIAALRAAATTAEAAE